MSDAWWNRVYLGSCENMAAIPDASVHCCVTSPPYYGLRNYRTDGQIGIEETVEEYVERLLAVFREVRRTLRDDGTLWLNLGDSYAGPPRGRTDDAASSRLSSSSGRAAQGEAVMRGFRKRGEGVKDGDLFGVPWMVAFALRADGWYLRAENIWEKAPTMPTSAEDRPARVHEHVFLLAKSRSYYYDRSAVAQPVARSTVKRLAQNVAGQAGSLAANDGAKTNGPMKAVGNGETRNLRSVWQIAPEPFPGHRATYPRDLARIAVRAGAPIGGVVLDPFMGSGTTARVAIEEGRKWVGYEINPEFHAVIAQRLGLFGGAA